MVTIHYSHGMTANIDWATPRSYPATRHTKHLAKTQTGLADGPLLHFGAGMVAGIVGTSVTAPVPRLL